MGAHTARRFMGVADEYGDKTRIVRDLPPTALYELAAPKTPPEVREQIEAMIEAGEVVSAATVKDLRRKLVGLERRSRSQIQYSIVDLIEYERCSNSFKSNYIILILLFFWGLIFHYI